MTEKKYAWHKIAESVSAISFSSNGMAEITVAGKTICIARHNNNLYACTQKCPHAGGILADGHIDATGNIVCPLHRYKYSLQNGRNISGEGYYLKTYTIVVNAAGVFVNFDKVI